ncbi:hypothetical protein MLD38_006641 [Melastoma candidum]|uniref:Uncharacterized protein n=1 Tax=Melastoma candidum TaxID=119954 RepID=A0ACB9RP37_9MYRT|nr:hypothetical protein MLD38_006641 [Melastoma candidum]
MSPMLTTQAVVLATTAAMAVSGTVFLLALRLHQKTPPGKSRFLHSCFSSNISGTKEVPNEGTRSRGEKQSSGTNRRKKNKRVRFLDGVTVMDRAEHGNNGFERRRGVITNATDKNSCSHPDSSSATATTAAAATSEGRDNRGMPANRKALYNGILRDRLIQRVAYSY